MVLGGGLKLPSGCGFGLARRYVVLPKDFDKGYKKNVRKADTEHEFYRA